MLEVLTIPVTVFGQNARVLWCSETKKGVVVDPGGDAELLAQACSSNGIEVQEIWLTHSHLDHCAGVASLLVKYSVPLVAHPNEKMLREKIPDIAQMYGLPREDWPRCPEPDRVISGGEELWVGQVKAKVLFTPGHSPGHVSFYFPADRVLVSGDVLFQGSIGRTDLPGGDHSQLLDSIRRELLCLPDDTKVLSGHGGDTTIGEERLTNPFLMGLQ